VQLGAVVEFSLTHNARGFPQARNINWDPMGFSSPDTPNLAPRAVSPQTFNMLRQILDLMEKGQIDDAVVKAIDEHGKQANDSAAPNNNDVDLVWFVLERLGGQEESVRDFVKMLLLLYLSKTMSNLRKHRVLTFVRLFDRLSHTLDPKGKGVLEQLSSVVEHMEANLRSSKVQITEDQVLVMQSAITELRKKAATTDPTTSRPRSTPDPRPNPVPNVHRQPAPPGVRPPEVAPDPTVSNRLGGKGRGNFRR